MTQAQFVAQFAAEALALGSFTLVTLIVLGLLTLVAYVSVTLIVLGLLTLVAYVSVTLIVLGLLTLVAYVFILRGRRPGVRRGSDLRRFGPNLPRFRARS